MDYFEKKSFYPVLLNISGKKCLMVGGGNVALRKVKSMLEFKADITIISPELAFELNNLVLLHGITYQKKSYQPGDCMGYDIAFCATDDFDVNRLVVNDCGIYGILVNVADSPELSSFILPATIKKQDVTISIADQGKAPFYIKKLKEDIERMLPGLIDEVARLAAEFRAKVMTDRRFNTAAKRNEILRKFLDEDWASIIKNKGMDEVYIRMAEILK